MMSSRQAFGLIRSYRAYCCRLPITSQQISNSLNGAYRIRLASTVAGNGTANSISSDNISASVTSGSTKTTTGTTIAGDGPANAIDTTNLQFKWEVAEEVVQSHHPKLTGAIVPFAQQSFIQKLFLPYTFSVMYYMDFLLNYMPWWGAIATTTATCKIIFFPLLVKQQRDAIKTHNLLPQSQALQTKINEAMMVGDSYGTALNRSKLKLLYDEHGLGIRSRLWPAFVQAPMFMSIFFLLRKLTSEVESMTTSGTLWFTDLTVPDPYFILPIITCTSLFALLELGLGVEGAGAAAATSRPLGKWLMRCIPVGLFGIIYNFPAATLLFWTTNNVLSFVTALTLKQKLVKRKFNIPERIIHDPATLPLTNQTLTGQIKAAREMSQASKSTHDIRRLDDIAFKKAGVGPLKKTYKHPPAQGG